MRNIREKMKPTLNKVLSFRLLIAIALFIITITVVKATPPGSPYNPGETLNPVCAPGDSNCTIYPPVSLTNNNQLSLGTDNPVAKLTVRDTNPGTVFAIRNVADTDSVFTVTDTGLVTISNNVGIGTTAPNEFLTVEGRLSLRETTAPSATANYGKLYTLSTDSKLYYMDDSGMVYDLTAAAGVSGSGLAGQAAFWTSPSALSGDNNFFWDNTNKRLGIGTATPAALLSVGSTSQFQVNSAGAIAAATGITSSGTITFSGLTTQGPVIAGAGGVLSSEAQLAIARGGTGGTATPTAGAVAYGTGTAYGFSAAGNTNQLLTSGGTGAPSWSNIASLLTAGTNISITGTTNATIATIANPTFSTSVTTPLIIGTNIRPSTDSTTAIQLQNATGTAILNVDTTNQRVGIGTTTPGYILDVAGDINIGAGNVYRRGGTAGSIFTCPAGQVIKDATVSGGIITAGICAADETGAISWPLLAPDGTTTAPSYSFTNDPDMGIYRGGTDILRFATAGTDRLTIDAAGNVGIGDATPVSLLTVGSGDLFQVSSGGAIAAATGITSSGTITFSGLTTQGPVIAGAGGVLSSEAQLAIARGGTGGTATPTAGAVAYGTGTAYGFSAAGNTNQLLTSGGTGAPSWSNIASLLTAGTNISITGTTNATIATVADPTFTTSVTTPFINLTNSTNQIVLDSDGISTGTITMATLGASRTWTLPDASGTIALGSGTQNYATYWQDANTLAAEQYLAVSRGGTGAGTFTQYGVLYGNATSAIGVTAAGTSGQLLVANASGVPTFVTMSGDATLAASGALTISPDAVALGTDTTGNYLATASGTSPILVSGSGVEGAAITISCPTCVTSASGGTDLFTLAGSSGTSQTISTGDTLTIAAGTNITTTAGATDTVTVATVANPTFSTSVTTPLIIGTNIRPSTDSTTAIQLQNAAGTAVLNVDTTNQRVGVGTAAPAYILDVAGTAQMTGFRMPTGASAGYVLTSDATGLASWQSPTTLLPTGTSGQTLRHDGTNWVANSLLFNDGTNVGIGTTAPNTILDIAGALSVRGITTPAVSLAGQGRIYFDPTANKFKVSENGGAFVDLVGAGGGGVGGGWTDDGGVVRLTTATDRVGIGIEDPLATVHINEHTTTTLPPLRIDALVQQEFLAGWNYRRPITITNSTVTSLTDYQVLIIIDTASLISAGKMKPDCGDIRFTDSDKTTLLNYWIESGVNTVSTKIWVKVPSIPASGSKTIYIYYGNQNTTSLSSTTTFIREIPGVIGAWRLDEGSGTTVYDMSGQNWNGTFTNAPTWIDAKYYKGLEFRRPEADGVVFPHKNVGSVFTILQWVRHRTVGDWNTVFGYRHNGGASDLGILYIRNTHTLEYWFRSVARAVSSATVPHNSWTSLALTQNGTAVKLLRNGTVVATGSLPAGATWNSPFYIGNSWHNEYWYNGDVDEFRVYNRELTAAELADASNPNYYGYVTPDYPGRELIRRFISPEPTINVSEEETSSSGQLRTFFYIQNNTGNVGIGTIAPEAKLHVATNGNVNTQSARFYNPDLATDGLYNYISIGKTTGANNAFEVGYRYDTTPGDEGGWLSVSGDSAGTGIFIKKGGNVGIGTTAPISNLDIRGATAFGGIAQAGAFIDNNSYMSEEFNADMTAGTTADSATLVGDVGRWYFDTTATSLSYSQADQIGGFGRIITGTTSGRGGLVGFGEVQNNLSLIFAKANLPVVQMKVRTSGVAATEDIVWGLMDRTTAVTANNTLPVNGIFFWHNNGTSWVGFVRSGGANVGTVTCPGTISTTQFAVGRIEVLSPTAVRFWMDYNASDGVNFTECGTVTGAGPTANLGIALYTIHTDTTSRNIDIDYARVWQDDSLADGVSLATVEKVEQDLVSQSSLTQFFPADNLDMEEGTLVSVDTTQSPIKVRASDNTSNLNIIGVVATNPGLELHNSTFDGVRVAISGRARIKVSAENGSIKVGDYLTSSNIPGVAMKATEPGRVIGIALESFGFEKSEILNPEGEPSVPYGAGPKSETPNSTTSLVTGQANSPEGSRQVGTYGAGNDQNEFRNSDLEIRNSLPVGKVMVFVNPHWSLGQISEDGSLTMDNEQSLGGEQPTILDQFTLAIKKALEKLGLIVQNGIAKIKEIIAEKITTKEITTSKLCVEGDDGEQICIDKNQLKDLLERNQNYPASGPGGASAGEQPPVTTPSSEPASGPDGVPAVEQASTKQPPVREQPIEQPTEQSQIEESTTEQPAENLAAEQPSTEQPVEQLAEQTPTEQSAEQSQTEESVVEQPVENPSGTETQ